MKKLYALAKKYRQITEHRPEPPPKQSVWKMPSTFDYGAGLRHVGYSWEAALTLYNHSSIKRDMVEFRAGYLSVDNSD